MQNRKDQAIIALGLNVIQGACTIKLFKRKRQMLPYELAEIAIIDLCVYAFTKRTLALYN